LWRLVTARSGIIDSDSSAKFSQERCRVQISPDALRTGLAWSRVARGRRARALRRLLETAGTPVGVLALSPPEAARLAGEAEDVVAPLLAPDLEKTDEDLRRLEAAGARILFFGDEEYPALVREITDPPPLLFACGAPLPVAPAVALVGARRATRAGLEVAALLAAGLARAGVAVVSGFARGVDVAAHRAALDAEGPTVAVFGCGVDVCYPPEQTGLLERLLKGGTALSEFPMGDDPEPWHFPVRNRLIAGLARIVCVVEAAEKSGSLITARCATGYGRDVAAVPGPVLSPVAAGANALLKDGAILVRTADDLLAELPEADRRLLNVSVAARAAAALPHLPPDAAALLAALDPDDPRDADALIPAAGLDAGRFGAALLFLEIEGLATALPGALFVRTRPRI
jgi:DNA processing protein